MPKYDEQSETLDSEVAEFGIACEACHGPGEQHIQRFRNPWNRYRQRLGWQTDTTIVNPSRLSKHASTFICGRCHSDFKIRDPAGFLQDGLPFLPGDEDLFASLQLSDFENPPPGLEKHVAQLCWQDGTCRTGGDELNAHVKSPCYLRGELTCLSCHSMHKSAPNDQLAKGMASNQACLQCHNSFAADLSAHTHHAADSSGSLCYNCHMPHTTYALSTAMRSHRIDSPSVAVSSLLGRPNACNLCHVDRSMQWAAEYLTSWYGTAAVELNDEQRQVSATVLWLLKGDALQRAIAAWHLGWEPARDASGDQWQALFLAQLLQDPYAQVRLISSESLRQMPGFADFEYDFLAGQQQHMEDTNRAVEHWESQSDITGERRVDRLLGRRGQGQIARQRMQQLLDERNDSPVSIPE